MDEQRWEKLAAYTGVAAIIGFMVSYLLPGTPPASDAAAEEVLAWATDKRDAILLSAFVGSLGGMAFLWWLSSLRSYLRTSEGGTGRLSAIVFGAGLLSILGGGIAAVFSVMAVMRLPGGADAATVRLMQDGAQAMYTLSWFPAAVMAVAVAVLCMRRSVFPKWFGYVSYLTGVGSLLAGYGLGATSGAFASDGAVTMAIYGLSTIWYIAAIALLIPRVGRASA